MQLCDTSAGRKMASVQLIPAAGHLVSHAIMFGCRDGTNCLTGRARKPQRRRRFFVQHRSLLWDADVSDVSTTLMTTNPRTTRRHACDLPLFTTLRTVLFNASLYELHELRISRTKHSL